MSPNMEQDGDIAEFLLPQDGEHHPRIWYDRCLGYEEHQHLKDGEPNVGFLLRTAPKIVHERMILGTVHMPQVSGSLREVFAWMLTTTFNGTLDFLIILDAAYWAGAGDREREILMFHEMTHCVQKVDQWGAPRYARETGLPVWGLRGHDVEEFTSVVARYGAHSPEIEHFITACKASPTSKIQKGDATEGAP